jgi:hypothetical protein
LVLVPSLRRSSWFAQPRQRSPMAAAQPAAFKRFSLGDFEITVLSDGHRVVPGKSARIFGMNTTSPMSRRC